MNSIIIKLHNIALTSKCDLNVILLSQVRENDIIFHNNPNTMTLMKDSKIIAYAIKGHNLFTLNLAISDQITLVISKKIMITS